MTGRLLMMRSVEVGRELQLLDSCRHVDVEAVRRDLGELSKSMASMAAFSRQSSQQCVLHRIISRLYQ